MREGFHRESDSADTRVGARHRGEHSVTPRGGEGRRFKSFICMLRRIFPSDIAPTRRPFTIACMTKIAHLSDVHLVEDHHRDRDGASRLRLSFLTLGRPCDAVDRRRRFSRALHDAYASGAEHLVVTGDLTEDGVDAQVDVLAELLDDGPWDPRRVTLVPGNHDAYHDEHAWARALRGPLAAYAKTSTPGAVTEVGDALVVAVSPAFKQPVVRSAGRIGEAQLARLRRIAEDLALARRAVIFAQHHPPVLRGLAPVQWIDGLEGWRTLHVLLRARRNVHVLCGHTHHAYERSVRAGEPARIFTASSVVDDLRPLRLYEIDGERVRPHPEAVPMRDAAELLARSLTDDVALEC